jgi:hypothetical protein
VLLLDPLQELLVGVYGVWTGGQGRELELGLLQDLACGGEGKGCGKKGRGLVGFQRVCIRGRWTRAWGTARLEVLCLTKQLRGLDTANMQVTGKYWKRQDLVNPSKREGMENANFSLLGGKHLENWTGEQERKVRLQ